jgi:hypothetical protein
MTSLISCDKTEKFIPAPLYTEYFPLKTGNYIIYDVDSTSFNSQTTRYSYELKDLVAGSFYDQEHRLNYRIERYHRRSSPGAWELMGVWTAIPSDIKLITFEQNTNYVRMFFPVNTDQTWDINAYNNQAAQKVMYTDIHLPFKMGTVFVDSSVTVVEKADTLNLIRNEYQKRVYGLHTGLVYFYRDSLKLEFHPQRKGDTIGGYQIKFLIKEHNY